MIELPSAMRGRSRPGLALALLGLICAAVLMTHSPISMGHDTEGGDHAMQDALSVCLAIVGVAGTCALLLLAASGLLRRRRSSRDCLLSIMPPRPVLGPASSARASPASLQVFRL